MSISNNLQDHSQDVSLSPSLWKNMPSPYGSRIQSLVGSQEAQHGFEQSWVEEVLRPQ